MKPKLVLCLALVVSGILPGCSTGGPYSEGAEGSNRNSDPNGLTCRIFVPSLKLKQDGTIPAVLLLKNEGSKPLRICTIGDPWRSIVEGGQFDIRFVAGIFKSDGLPPGEFYKYATMLRPAESVRLPFEIIAETNAIVHVTAHFSSDTNNIPEQLGCWYGEIDAKPITIKIER